MLPRPPIQFCDAEDLPDTPGAQEEVRSDLCRRHEECRQHRQDHQSGRIGVARADPEIEGGAGQHGGRARQRPADQEEVTGPRFGQLSETVGIAPGIESGRAGNHGVRGGRHHRLHPEVELVDDLHQAHRGRAQHHPHHESVDRAVQDPQRAQQEHFPPVSQEVDEGLAAYRGAYPPGGASGHHHTDGGRDHGGDGRRDGHGVESFGDDGGPRGGAAEERAPDDLDRPRPVDPLEAVEDGLAAAHQQVGGELNAEDHDGDPQGPDQVVRCVEKCGQGPGPDGGEQETGAEAEAEVRHEGGAHGRAQPGVVVDRVTGRHLAGRSHPEAEIEQGPPTADGRERQEQGPGPERRRSQPMEQEREADQGDHHRPAVGDPDRCGVDQQTTTERPQGRGRSVVGHDRTLRGRCGGPG